MQRYLTTTLQKPSVRLALVALLLVAAATAPLWLSDYYVQLSTRSLFFALAAMSFILLAGYGGMMSLAQMSFFTMGGYVVAVGVVTYKWSFWVAIPLALLAATLLSAVFGLVAIRAKGIYFLMMTLALSQVAYGVALQWTQVTRGWDGFSGVPRPKIGDWSLIDINPQYYVALIVVIACYLALRRLVRSPFGLALQGVRDNPVRMAALGYNVQLHRFLAILISGLFAGVAGVLGVFHYGGVSPQSTGLWNIMLVVMSAIAGGAAVLEGGIVGAFITFLLISLAGQFTQHYMTVIGFVLMLVILFLPQGILGNKKRLQTIYAAARDYVRRGLRATPAQPAALGPSSDGAKSNGAGAGPSAGDGFAPAETAKDETPELTGAGTAGKTG